MGKEKKYKGFTIIELLIVVGLFIILSAMTIPFTLDFYHKQAFETEVKAVTAVLERARSYAISGRENSDWGVKFFPEGHYYDFFKGSEYNPDDPYKQRFILNSDLVIDGIDEIIFEAHTGIPRILGYEHEEDPIEFACEDSITFIYNGQEVTYGTVVGQNNTCWMDRNLGADPDTDPSEYSGYDDSRGYGDLFQWGRLDDGHQVRSPAPETNSTLSTTNDPEHSDFIINLQDPYNWINPQNNDLWQGVDGINNPCPDGFRIPTEEELNNERIAWSSQHSTGAFNSSLKWTLAGMRSAITGSLSSEGGGSACWSSSVDGTDARNLSFGGGGAGMHSRSKGYGLSVRCIKN